MDQSVWSCLAIPTPIRHRLSTFFASIEWYIENSKATMSKALCTVQCYSCVEMKRPNCTQHQPGLTFSVWVYTGPLPPFWSQLHFLLQCVLHEASWNLLSFLMSGNAFAVVDGTSATFWVLLLLKRLPSLDFTRRDYLSPAWILTLALTSCVPILCTLIS